MNRKKQVTNNNFSMQQEANEKTNENLTQAMLGSALAWLS